MMTKPAAHVILRAMAGHLETVPVEKFDMRYWMEAQTRTVRYGFLVVDNSGEKESAVG